MLILKVAYYKITALEDLLGGLSACTPGLPGPPAWVQKRRFCTEGMPSPVLIAEVAFGRDCCSHGRVWGVLLWVGQALLW